MSRYAYLQPITANPHQLITDLAVARRGNLQVSKLAALAARGWGDTLEAIQKTVTRLDQLLAEMAKIPLLTADDPRRETYTDHMIAAGLPIEPTTIRAWFAAAEPNRPHLHQEADRRPADYYDRVPVQLFGLAWIELPPDCRVGSFTKAVTRAHSSPAEAADELKSRGLPAGDLLLKSLWDGRWQVFQRRQVTGRAATPMGSYAKKAPLGTGRLFIR
ncbi:MAG: hypothetical protein ABFE13_24865 [Phycisphaerales bacterium]